MRPTLLFPVALLLSLAACGDDDGPAPTPDAGRDAGGAEDGGGDAGPVAGCTPVGLDPEVVHFDTDDGVTLEAALFVEGTVGGPGLVLLHMIPPTNDRSNYARPVIDTFVARGFTVLNVDRRGAGGSEGEALDAYMGPNGRLDAKAAVAYLLAHPCGLDPTRIALVGASNGTATVLDYTVMTATDDTLETPVALVFLTGGTYTEAQNAVADNRATLDPIPLLFVYSTAEREWSAPFEAGAPTTWQFNEYAGGDHGTRMFSAVPTSVTDVADFLRAAIGP
jgi:pimeloyl-ACP methyl ester carboxylesterase